MGKKIKTKITDKHKFTVNMLEDYDYRTTVFAVIAFVITVALRLFSRERNDE